MLRGKSVKMENRQGKLLNEITKISGIFNTIKKEGRTYAALIILLFDILDGGVLCFN